MDAARAVVVEGDLLRVAAHLEQAAGPIAHVSNAVPVLVALIEDRADVAARGAAAVEEDAAAVRELDHPAARIRAQTRAQKSGRRGAVLEQGVVSRGPGRDALEADAAAVRQDQFRPLKGGAVADQVPLARMGPTDAELPGNRVGGQVGAAQYQRDGVGDDEVIVFPRIDAGARVDAPLVTGDVQRLAAGEPHERGDDQKTAHVSEVRGKTAARAVGRF